MIRRLDRLERNILDRMGKNGKMWMISADCDRGVRVVEKMMLYDENLVIPRSLQTNPNIKS